MIVAAPSPTIPSAMLTVPATLPKAGSWRMSKTEQDDTDRHQQQSHQQQGVEHGLVRLPKEHQCRTLIGGNAVGVVGPVISCPCDSQWVSSGVQPVSVVLAPRRLARIWGWQ